uniref:Uncharacterized protein n=1 Tax=Sphaerodactylus townsendi TaxID=933632 RepID=A0ACB8FM44_9SAUR
MFFTLRVDQQWNWLARNGFESKSLCKSPGSLRTQVYSRGKSSGVQQHLFCDNQVEGSGFQLQQFKNLGFQMICCWGLALLCLIFSYDHLVGEWLFYPCANQQASWE